MTEEPILLFLVYVVATPVVGVVLVLVLRWVFRHFPSRTRRDLDDLKMRVRTLEGVVEHLAKKDAE